MILEQHYLDCLAQASYLIVDEQTGTAAVVDPRRDVDVYLDRAEALGATIRHVILTHLHADFLAGHLELAERTGAVIYLGAAAEADYEFTALSEGSVLHLGDVRLEVLETPGHTPEGISILVFDESVSTEAPRAVLTGDTLFIGDVGRPDLMASKGVSARELAGMMYDSLRSKLMTLPDDTIVYPGHGAGSACGKNLSSETSSTIGRQKQLNYALQDMSKEAFIDILTADQPPPPAYFPVAAQLNRERHASLPRVVADASQPMSLDETLAAAEDGVQVLDVRAKDSFARRHLAGSISIGLDGKLASWAGSVLDLERPIVIVAEPGTEREAILRLGRIGLDQTVGYLDGGAGAFQDRPECTATTPRIRVDDLAARCADSGAIVLDVRGPGEWDEGHIEGALHVPLAMLAGRLDDIPRDRTLLVCCKSGYRSMTATSLLAREGYYVVDVEGGFDAWVEAGLPVAVRVATT